MPASYFLHDIGNTPGVVNAMPVFETAVGPVCEMAMQSADFPAVDSPPVLEQVAA
ncbi:MAG: hypothetical protein RLZZ08_350 [Pseudomonadota bacterium]|jgi:hypothetical protein